MKRVHSVKDLGVTVTSNLKFSQQCKESFKRSNRTMGLIKRFFLFKNKDLVLPLYNSFVRLTGVSRTVLVFPPCESKDKVGGNS